MSDTDYAKFFTDVWTKAGGTLTAAQAQMFKDMSERMGSAFMLPLQAMNAGGNVGETGEKFRKFFESSAKLSQALTPAAAQSAVTDGVTVELLQKIFDPREWLSATGYMDESVRRIAEG